MRAERDRPLRVLLLPAPYVHGTVGSTVRAIALAHALQRLGCEVAFVAAGPTAAMAGAEGYRVFQSPMPHAADTAVPLRSVIDSISWTGLGEEGFIRLLVEAELAAVRDFRPDAAWGDFHPTAIISMTAADVPLASIAVWPSHPDFPANHVNDPNAPAFNSVLRDFGQPLVDTSVELLFVRSALRIAPTLPELEPELTHACDATFVGHLIDLGAASESAPPPAFMEWPPRRRGFVYMSVTGPPPAILVQIVRDAFAGTDLHALVATGFHVEAAALPSGDDHVRVARYVPAQPVIEHAAFVVAHGGQNTLASGLYYGVPSIHFPGDAVERQYNAEQLERCGAGISLPLAALRPRRLQRALEELLSGPYMRNAREIAQRVRLAGGAQAAAAHIVTLARGRQARASAVATNLEVVS